MSHIVGNLISSIVLKPEVNSTSIHFSPSSNCGANDCPGGVGSSELLKRPQSSTVYLLCTIYVGLGATSILLIKFFLREYGRKKDNEQLENGGRNENQFELLISTVTQMKDKYQLLIIPLTLWMGFSLAFMGADYTKSFVACTKG